jgi:hypothetical protein
VLQICRKYNRLASRNWLWQTDLVTSVVRHNRNPWRCRTRQLLKPGRSYCQQIYRYICSRDYSVKSRFRLKRFGISRLHVSQRQIVVDKVIVNRRRIALWEDYVFYNLYWNCVQYVTVRLDTAGTRGKCVWLYLLNLLEW